VILQTLDDMCRKPERKRFQMPNVVDASRRELTRAVDIELVGTDRLISV